MLLLILWGNRPLLNWFWSKRQPRQALRSQVWQHHLAQGKLLQQARDQARLGRVITRRRPVSHEAHLNGVCKQTNQSFSCKSIFYSFPTCVFIDGCLASADGQISWLYQERTGYTQSRLKIWYGYFIGSKCEGYICSGKESIHIDASSGRYVCSFNCCWSSPDRYVRDDCWSVSRICRQCLRSLFAWGI
jgi:hypothetical protein